MESNIQDTVGVDHEIIVINNENNQYSITQAYNIGVSKAKFEIVCFMHDDITYNSKNWGRKVISHFKNPKVGAIAVAGSPFHSFFPGSWFSSKILNIYLLQGDKNKDKLSYINQINQITESNEIVSFDGCWFCVRKKMFSKIRFDEVNFKGFHFYDADLALQIYRTGMKVITVNDILISHFSGGSMNLDYIKHSMLFHQKWKRELPVYAHIIPRQIKIKAEFTTLEEFIWICSKNHTLNKKTWKKVLLMVLERHYFHIKTPYYIFKSLKKILY
ncbi:glycosyltransferase [Pedobacter rhizosphaerae]|uniref:glycosyltransferase n=1 Tax=Pedobacter rhizosphaerae TaxID=390241 RepID=UPI001FE20949